MDQPGFFDIDERLARLSGLGDQLETRKNHLFLWLERAAVAIDQFAGVIRA